MRLHGRFRKPISAMETPKVIYEKLFNNSITYDDKFNLN